MSESKLARGSAEEIQKAGHLLTSHSAERKVRKRKPPKRRDTMDAASVSGSAETVLAKPWQSSAGRRPLSREQQTLFQEHLCSRPSVICRNCNLEWDTSASFPGLWGILPPGRRAAKTHPRGRPEHPLDLPEKDMFVRAGPENLVIDTFTKEIHCCPCYGEESTTEEDDSSDEDGDEDEDEDEDGDENTYTCPRCGAAEFRPPAVGPMESPHELCSECMASPKSSFEPCGELFEETDDDSADAQETDCAPDAEATFVPRKNAATGLTPGEAEWLLHPRFFGIKIIVDEHSEDGEEQTITVADGEDSDGDEEYVEHLRRRGTIAPRPFAPDGRNETAGGTASGRSDHRSGEADGTTGGVADELLRRLHRQCSLSSGAEHVSSPLSAIRESGKTTTAPRRRTAKRPARMLEPEDVPSPCFAKTVKNSFCTEHESPARSGAKLSGRAAADSPNGPMPAVDPVEFARLAIDIVNEYKSSTQYTVEALEALQEATEDYIQEAFSNSLDVAMGEPVDHRHFRAAVDIAERMSRRRPVSPAFLLTGRAYDGSVSPPSSRPGAPSCAAGVQDKE